MKQSHRRQMIGNLAAFFAAPLALGRLGFDTFCGVGEQPKTEPKSSVECGKFAVRPRISAPKGSVMRRG